MHESQQRLRREVDTVSRQPRWREPRWLLAGGLLVSLGVLGLVAASAGTLDPEGREALVEVTYHVKPGDTISAIASRFRVAGGQQKLVAVNRLTNANALRPGQPLQLVAPLHRLVGLRQLFPDAIAPAPTCKVSGYGRETRSRPGIADCNEKVCRTGPRGTRVCQCWGAESSILVQEPGKAELRVPVPTTMRPNLMAGDIDVDGDGAAELVVALHQGTSNGIALMYYTVLIFDGTDRRLRLSFSTVGWGVAAEGTAAELDGLFLRAAGASACAVAPASFEHLRDPVLGAGNYMAQRLYHYRRGALSAPARLDLRVQRLHPRAPLQRWPREARPSCMTYSKPAAATIQRIDTSKPDAIRARVRLSGGKVRDVTITRVLDTCVGAYYPKDYRTASWESLIGRRARLLCASTNGEPVTSSPIALACAHH